jgi:H3 lysine-79-specific histone-lysine N-methyltransferase
MCYGFEKAEWPAKCAELMEKEFIFWMNFFGKSYSNFKIYKADFLSDDEPVTIDSLNSPRVSTMNEYVKEIISDAKLVFVNNYAFTADLNHQLKLRFCNMTEGSFILSSKSFRLPNFRVNERNLNDIATIINIKDFEPLRGQVSWTSSQILYFLQKIDRTELEKYYKEISSKSRSELSRIKDILQELSQTRSSTPCVSSEIFNLNGSLTKFGKDSSERNSGLKFTTLQATDKDGKPKFKSVFYFVI